MYVARVLRLALSSREWRLGGFTAHARVVKFANCDLTLELTRTQSASGTKLNGASRGTSFPPQHLLRVYFFPRLFS